MSVSPDPTLPTLLTLPTLPSLFDNLRDGAGADRAAALANREPAPLLDRHRRDQLPAIGVLSPGITISTPSGSVSTPVTSVVRM